MTKQTINIGATANDRTGDSLRSAFTKVNENFTELYTQLGLLSDTTLNLGAFEFTGSTISTTDSSAIVIDQAVTVSSNLTVGGDILPSGNLSSTLGSPTNKFHSIYVGTGSVYIGDAKLSLENGTINSSVGFSTDNLTVGGVSITVNGDGALESSGGFVATVAESVSWTNVTDKPTIPADVSDLTDTGNLLGGGSGLTGWTVATGNHIVPATDNLQDIGTPANRVRHVYVGPGSVYIGNNVITESATGGLVLPGVTRATGYYAEEVENEDRWGSNPTITGTVTVIDATRYQILAGQTPSARYNPATYTVQKDGNRVDEINVSSGGSGWTKAEADYARDNNMYATNVAGAINNFNAGNWQQIPFRVEIKAEDTEYEDIFGSANLGDLVIENSNISSDESQNFVNLDVDGAGWMRLGTFNNEKLQLVVDYDDDEHIWEFGTDGNLKLPVGGDIVDSNGDSVLGGSASLGNFKIAGSTLGTQGADSNSWGDHNLYLDPGGESSAYIYLPNVENQNDGVSLQIWNYATETSKIELYGRGGVQIIAGASDSSDKIFEFDNDGSLKLPPGGDIVNSSGQSVLGGGSNSYTPEDSDNWNSPTVNTIAAALDELAAKVAALENFEIDGGNANTPAAGELLIDGNGA